jgi:hypothetical protein
MQAIEVQALVDHEGQLRLVQPLPVRDQRVRVLVLLPEAEDLSDALWLNGVSQNPAFDFLNDEDEDVYSLNDGKPMAE